MSDGMWGDCSYKNCDEPALRGHSRCEKHKASQQRYSQKKRTKATKAECERAFQKHKQSESYRDRLESRLTTKKMIAVPEGLRERIKRAGLTLRWCSLKIGASAGFLAGNFRCRGEMEEMRLKSLIALLERFERAPTSRLARKLQPRGAVPKVVYER